MLFFLHDTMKCGRFYDIITMLHLLSMCLHHAVVLASVYLAYFSLRQMFHYSFGSILKCLPSVPLSLLDNCLLNSRLLTVFLWGCHYRSIPDKWLLMSPRRMKGKGPECARDYRETERSFYQGT